MGGKNKGSKPQTTTTSQAPFLADQARQFGQGAQNYYESSQPAFAPFSDTSQAAIGASDPMFSAANTELTSTIGGEYLGANPYLQNVAARAGQDAMSGINATFGGAGRTGGGLHQQALTEGLGNVSANIYAPAYERERARMMGAAGAAPGLIAGQLSVGGAQEAKDMEQQLAPYTQLARYGQLISMPSGGTGFSTGPAGQGRSPLAGGLGGALAGGSIGSQIGGGYGGWGSLIGGGLGALGAI